MLPNIVSQPRKKIYGKYTTAVINSWISGDDQTLKENANAIEEEVVKNSIKLTDDNSDSYPQSRYSMFTDYIADIDYLFNLSEISLFREYLQILLDLLFFMT